MVIRTLYDDQQSVFSDLTGHENKEPTLTKQSDLREVDINEILKKYRTTGEIANVRQAMPQWVSLEQGLTLQDALMQIEEAYDAFEQNLPAEVRRMYNNDPGALLAELDLANKDAAIRSKLEKLGVIKAPDRDAAIAAGQVASPVVGAPSVAPPVTSPPVKA